MLLRAALMFLTLLAACAPIEVETPFDAREVAFVQRPGTAVVEGQAFLRQRGGGVVTCAGAGVVLVPAGGYATEYFTKAFGRRAGGLAGPLTGAPSSVPPDFVTYALKGQCDAGGNFAFSRVPAGEYYLISQVTWTVGNNIIPEGGVIGRRISVAQGSRQRVLLAV